MFSSRGWSVSCCSTADRAGGLATCATASDTIRSSSSAAKRARDGPCGRCKRRAVRRGKLYHSVAFNSRHAEYKCAEQRRSGAMCSSKASDVSALATWLEDDAARSTATEATGRPACKERAVRHADQSNRRELSDERRAQYPTDRQPGRARQLTNQATD